MLRHTKVAILVQIINIAVARHVKKDGRPTLDRAASRLYYRGVNPMDDTVIDAVLFSYNLEGNLAAYFLVGLNDSYV